MKAFTEVHAIGLFNSAVWDKLLKDSGFVYNKYAANIIYEQYMLQEREYPQIVFICER